MNNFNQDEFNKRKTQSHYWNATGAELLAAYNNGDRDFSHMTIKDANLEKADLSGSNFYDANFFNVNLDESDLSKSNIESATIKNCQLTDTNFNCANLEDTAFYMCLAYNANFSGVEAEYSFFQNCDLTGASFIKSNFRASEFNSILIDDASCNQTNFKEAIFMNVDFTQAYLIETNFRYAKFENVSLLNAELNNPNFLDVKGLYSIFGMNLSSRLDNLYGGVTVVDGKIELCLWAGCQGPISVEELILQVEEKHGRNIHARTYKKAIRCIEDMFKIDNSLHKWDYLIELHNREISSDEG